MANQAAHSLGSLPQRLTAWLAADQYRRWWVLVLFLGALALRLHWNLVVHPPGSFIYSDMKGYSNRANLVLDAPFATREYDAFFPFGTTWLVAAIKFVFGRDNYPAVGVVYALLGAGIVAMSYAIVDRTVAGRPRWVAPAVGLFLTIYYPLIAVGGYVLSELPYCFCLTLALLLLVRLVDDGRSRDAWLLGLVLGLGCWVRSQLVVSIALIGGYWLLLQLRDALRRRRGQVPDSPYTKLGWRQLAFIAVPLVVLLAVASLRFHAHTGRVGLVSENSTINLVFGRCHNKGIYARRDGQGHGTIRFSPPPLIRLEIHSKQNPDAWFQSRSVWGDDASPVEGVEGFAVDGLGCKKRKCRLPGSEIEYRGYIGDGDIHRRLVAACIERGGWRRQAYFSFTHWVLLWKYNLMWPDQANPRPRPSAKHEGWRAKQEFWLRAHRGVVMVPALIGLAFVAVPRRRPKQALIALNFVALLLIAAIWLGGIRFRIPYDPILIMLAAMVLGEASEGLRRRLARRRKAGVSEPGPQA